MLYRITAGVLVSMALGSPSLSYGQWSSDSSANTAVSTATANQQSPQIVSDGSGGAFLAWQDDRNGNFDIFAQRLDPDGEPQWTANGIAVCTAIGAQASPALILDGGGGIIIAWQDARSGNNDIYAARVDGNGNPVWTSNGVQLTNASGDQNEPRLTTDDINGAIVAWYDLGGASNIHAQRVNAAGTVLWAATGVDVCAAAGAQLAARIVRDGSNGAFVIWHDHRAGSDSDVYAQRINGGGNLLWATNGVAVSGALGAQLNATLASDGGTGFIACWRDERNGGINETDVYAQRIDENGSALWLANGDPVCTATGAQFDPIIAEDGSGGAIISWWDNRDGNYDIYAQRKDSAGNSLWSPNGVAACSAAGDQKEPYLIPAGSGGAIVSWYDGRGADMDVYAQMLNSSGAAQWSANGLVAGSASGDQTGTRLASDSTGGAIIAWQDMRSGSNDVYASRIGNGGTLVPVTASLFKAD